jgi:hypothetical protein
MRVATFSPAALLTVAVLSFGCADVQNTQDEPIQRGDALCAAVVCNDENGCTGDVCNPVDGTCLTLAVDDGAICDFDGAPGQCAAGMCEDAALCDDSPIRCDDENDCTEDLCNPANGQCSNDTVTNGLPCDFEGAPGVCTDGACEDAMLCIDASTRCNDGETCTTDTCDPQTGTCTNDPRTGTCHSEEVNFGLVLGDCTEGTCVKRFCEFSAQCSDNNECTSDSCDSFTNRCVNTKLNGSSCRSGTGTCRKGVCLFNIIILPPPILTL